jgi:hypothetical protein
MRPPHQGGLKVERVWESWVFIRAREHEEVGLAQARVIDGIDMLPDGFIDSTAAIMPASFNHAGVLQRAGEGAFVQRHWFGFWVK